MELDKAIKSRSSVRKFKSKKPDWRDIIECIDVARFIPKAGGNYTLKFIMVENPESIKNQRRVPTGFHRTSTLRCCCLFKSFKVKNAYGKQGENYSRQQAGAGIQNFLLKIEEAGLSTCWIGYFAESQIKHELKIPEEVNVEAVFPIGFEFEKREQKSSNRFRQNPLL